MKREKKLQKLSLTFLNYNNNKFILLFQESVYPYEYIDDWEQLNETSLLAK